MKKKEEKKNEEKRYNRFCRLSFFFFLVNKRENKQLRKVNIRKQNTSCSRSIVSTVRAQNEELRIKIETIDVRKYASPEINGYWRLSYFTPIRFIHTIFESLQFINSMDASVCGEREMVDKPKK